MDGVPFGRYRLIDLLGRGGMGEVWRAFDTVTERIVALKVLSVQFADDSGFQQRFRREARSAAVLDEPHVVPIYDFGEIEGRLFVTMRLINGQDLHTLLAGGPLDPARAVKIVDQVASALDAAHRADLIHRDVKPSNILVAEDDFAYLIDFGIARTTGQTSITNTGQVIGTWAYLAPERVTNDDSDHRADIYALTCVLFECLTGQQPFPGDSLEKQLGGHIALPPPRPSILRPGIPTAFDEVIAKGMAKNPDLRYPTTKELAAAARTALQPRVGQGRPGFTPPAEGPRIQPARPAPPRNENTRWWRRKVRRRSVAGVLAMPTLILLAAIVFAGFAVPAYFADRADPAQRREIVHTATDAMNTLWSYSPSDVDTLPDRAARYLSGDYLAQYSKYVNSIATEAKRAEQTSNSEVLTAGVETLNGSDATAVVYVNTTTTTPQTRATPVLTYYSYRLALQNRDKKWLITRMSTITSLEAKATPATAPDMTGGR